MDTLRHMLMLKWKTRRDVSLKMEAKNLPHIVKKLKEDTRNLDMEVSSTSGAVAEVAAKDGTRFRFVVNIEQRTYTCRECQMSGKPCAHAIALITSIQNKKVEDYVDMYFSIEKFKAAYEGVIPALPDKSLWPKSDYGFFMYPPLLIATSGRRKQQRYKGSNEGRTGNKGHHKCLICKD